jgi:hypothetical protein
VVNSSEPILVNGSEPIDIGHHKAVTGIPVSTAWDLGIGDPMAIWFYQHLPGQIRIVHYLEHDGEGIPWYASAIDELYRKNKWSRTGAIDVFPHDAKTREIGQGTARILAIKKAGFNIRIAPQYKFDDGIQAVRTLFPLCYFDAEGAGEGIKHLKNYRRQWNQERGCFSSTARHDASSHGADAFRYLAVSHKDIVPEEATTQVDFLRNNSFPLQGVGTGNGQIIIPGDGIVMMKDNPEEIGDWRPRQDRAVYERIR